jgi:predicted patatin/cPLA2 family phospholipase
MAELKNLDSIRNSIQFIRDYETNTKGLHSDIDTVEAELNELKDRYKHLVVNNELDEADKLHDELEAKEREYNKKVRRFATMQDTIPKVITEHSKKIAKYSQLLELEYREVYADEAEQLEKARIEYNKAKQKVKELETQFKANINYAAHTLDTFKREYNMHPTQVHTPNSASNNPFSNVLYDATGKEL